MNVVHAWHPSYVCPTDAHLVSGVDVLAQAARTILDEVVDQADARGLAGPIERTLVMGTAARAVLETAEGADLVVIGSRQQSGPPCSSARSACRSPITPSAPWSWSTGGLTPRTRSVQDSGPSWQVVAST